MIKKFDLQTVKSQIDMKAIENYAHLENRYLITNTDLELDNFVKISSVYDIDVEMINKSLFFLHFDSDDEYINELDRIIENNGKFLIQTNYCKYNYVHSNKKCNLALTDTMKCIDEISHYDVMIHQNICQALEQTKHLEGSYVEIGVYKGGSALTALNYMKHSSIKRPTYLFDTFDGFDYDEANDSSETHWEKNNDHHKLFGINETMNYIHTLLSRECPEQNFNLIKSNICSDELPSEIDKIAVANIDVDIYDATRDAISKVSEKMVKGGIIICEDPPSTPGLIGAYYAMEKFLTTPSGQKFMKLHLSGQYFLIKMLD